MLRYFTPEGLKIFCLCGCVRACMCVYACMLERKSVPTEKKTTVYFCPADPNEVSSAFKRQAQIKK